MTIALRQSTASQEIPLGHFVDSLDGTTAETGLTIANTDIKIWKAGATTLANKNSGGATHISGGIYHAVLDATDTDTVGAMVIFCAVSGALAVRLECHIYEEAVFDALYAASAPGYLQPTVAGRTLDVTATGAAGIDWGNVENKTTANVLSGTEIADVNVATIRSNAITASAIATGAITSAKFAAGAIDAAAIAANAIGASELAADAVAEIADAVWDEALSGHLSAGSTGEALNAAGSAGDPWTTTLPGSYTGSQAGKMLSDVLTDTGTTLQAELDGIQADTEDIQSRIPAALTAGGNIKADMLAISGDTTAADNLESATDGTGYNVGNGSVVAASVTGAVGSVTGAVGSVTGSVGSVASGGISAASIATGAIDADALAADAVDEILDEIVEGSTTLRQAVRLLLALTNKTTRSGSTIYFRDIADTKNRLAITIDSNADRTAVTRDAT